jgi:hypothetical protein
MKVLTTIALCLAAAVAQAQGGQETQQRGDENAAVSAVEKPQPRQPTTPFKAAGASRYQAASFAVSLTDDGDSLILPPFASKVTLPPTLVLRVGVRFSF